MILRWLFFLIICFTGIQCSSRTKSALVSDSTEPLSISVKDEINDGEHLRIVATLLANVEWPTDKAEISLITMHGDQLIEQRRMKLATFLNDNSKMLSAGTSYPILLNVPSKGADTYQLSLLWGAEAQSSEQADFRLAKVERKQVDCNPLCQEKISIIGELANKGVQPISSVELQIEIYKLPHAEQVLDLQGRKPDNVQNISVEGLNILAGKHRKLKLVLDVISPAEKDGWVNTPVVRVVKINE